MKRQTSVTIHDTSEGTRLSYTFSVIDDDGNVTMKNSRGDMVLLEKTETLEVRQHAKAIQKYIQDFLNRE